MQRGRWCGVAERHVQDSREFLLRVNQTQSIRELGAVNSGRISSHHREDDVANVNHLTANGMTDNGPSEEAYYCPERGTVFSAPSHIKYAHMSEGTITPWLETLCTTTATNKNDRPHVKDSTSADECRHADHDRSCCPCPGTS